MEKEYVQAEAYAELWGGVTSVLPPARSLFFSEARAALLEHAVQKLDATATEASLA